MDLRDWFAAQALAGIMSTAKYAGRGNEDLIARRSYDLADKMMTARKAQ